MIDGAIQSGGRRLVRVNFHVTRSWIDAHKLSLYLGEIFLNVIDIGCQWLIHLI
jgi:hypothetical protein